MGYFLGLGGPYRHDASAALIDESGTIVAFAEEERFTRVKSNVGSRAVGHAARYCLEEAGIGLHDLQGVAVGWNYRWPEDERPITSDSLIAEMLPPLMVGGTVRQIEIVNHHLAHAASTFYCSGYARSAVVIVDGSGDGLSTSIYLGDESGLTLLESMPISQSLGFFYESFSGHIGLGGRSGAGKMMGLAAYGTPRFDFDFVTTDETTYHLDLTRYGLPPSGPEVLDYENFTYLRTLKGTYGKAIEELGVDRFVRPPTWSRTRSGFALEMDYLQVHADLAASAQQALERCILAVCRRALELTASDNLCLAGGVALNCSANGFVRRQLPVDLFVQPVANDAGVAIGAAQELARRAGHTAHPRRLRDTALGPGFDAGTLRQELERLGVSFSEPADIADACASALEQNRIVGWFQGRSEAGPRALGSRSILGNPTSSATRERINRRIKHRDAWRPLAPSMLASAAYRYVDDPRSADFMIVAHQATEQAREEVPAVVHQDGSVRPQLVDPSVKPLYANLLSQCESRLGVPVVLNTSFNLENEPIVNSPLDAVRTFSTSELDALAIGPFWVTKA